MNKTKRKRKLRIERLLLVIAAFVLVIFIFVSLIKGVVKLFYNEKHEFDESLLNINCLDYSKAKELELDLYSKSYIVVELNNLEVLYGKNINEKFYPASLTKVLTLDTVCRNFIDYSDTSSISNDDYEKLIVENASLAGIKSETSYSLDDLLYALILPSGGDASVALENYFTKNGLDLVEEMNRTCSLLNLKDSNFTNTTGLHDENLYTTLNDYALIVVDTLKNDEAKSVLKALSKTLADGTVVNSTLSDLVSNESNITVFGGKTGFTGEAGENIMVLFDVDDKSYLIVLTGAPGNPYENNQKYHIKDAQNIINFLYN